MDRITNKETINLLDKGLQIPPQLAEKAYRRLFELEEETVVVCAMPTVSISELLEKPKRTYKRKERVE